MDANIKAWLKEGRKIVSAAAGRVGDIIRYDDGVFPVVIARRGLKASGCTTFDRGDEVEAGDDGSKIIIRNVGWA